MKEFYGGISFAGTASFSVKAEDESKAEEVVFEDAQGIELVLKDGSKVEITIANVDDFWIEEEK